MKATLLTIIVLALCLAPMVALAGVAGTDHDLTGSGEKLCYACHIPHNASGDKLWPTLPPGTFSGVQALCHSCHDGSTVVLGGATVMNASLEQHATVGSDCSGAGACHDVHNQNPALTGRFLVVTATNGNYCESCHGATPFAGAEGLGNHAINTQHYTGAGFTCSGCHTVHGATAQTTNPPTVTDSPILLADNSAGGYYGAFCISCHAGTAPTPAAVGTGGVAATDVFNYEEGTADGTEAMHPTITTGTAIPVGGCDACHDVHDPTLPAVGYILKEDNANSAYCVSCHDGTNAPAVGANTHYTGVPAVTTMNNGLTPAMPWATQIDEDGSAGADWATATANMMVCETCHSVHRQGFTGTDKAFLLRHPNGANNQICTACHVDN